MINKGGVEVVFLAAGQGVRMGALTELRPKVTVAVSGERSILEVNLAALEAAGVAAEVVVVGGHGWELLRQHVAACGSLLPLRTVLNERYTTAGPARSVLAALEARPDPAAPLVVANGDTVFEREVFALVDDLGDGAVLLGSEVAAVAADDLAVTLDGGSRVLVAAKGPAGDVPGRISAGLLVVRGEQSLAALDAAVRAVLAQEERTGWSRPWHDCLRHLAAAGRPARFLPVVRSAWEEFDDVEGIARYQDRALAVAESDLQP